MHGHSRRVRNKKLMVSACAQIIRGNSVASLELVDAQKVYQERPPMGAPRM